MPKMLVTVRQSFCPDVRLEVNLGLDPSKEKQVRTVVDVWTMVTGLAFGRMPLKDHSDVPGNEAYYQVELEHPLENRGPVFLYWDR